jgi:hypothetical protein
MLLRVESLSCRAGYGCYLRCIAFSKTGIYCFRRLAMGGACKGITAVSGVGAIVFPTIVQLEEKEVSGEFLRALIGPAHR